MAFLRASAAQCLRFVASVTLMVLLLLSTTGVAGWFLFQPKPDPTYVTTLKDDGPGSLRWSIDNAPSGSTITFDKSLWGHTILLTDDLPIIRKSLSIRGPGAHLLTINSNHGIVLFSDASIRISDLTFTGSKFNSESLLSNSGGLTITDSIISGNTSSSWGGGGISNAGRLTITNSTVSGNTAFEEGGGIINYTDSTIIINNSNISGNTVSGQDSDGGGITNSPNSRVTLTNSTISGNASSSKGGGISNFGSQVDMEFCTIYGNKTSSNGGGLFIENGQEINGKTVPSQVKISKSIIADNRASTGPDISGKLISEGYNLIQDSSGASFTANKERSTDVSVGKSTDLKIDPTLRKNGGLARTHALLLGSPAIDQIPLDACHANGITTDQRGVKRPQGSACDIGAYEYQPSQ